MEVRELKEYIYDNKYVEQILESIGCHHIRYHSSNSYWTCANATGDNNNAIVLYDNEYLMCTNYTRQMIKTNRSTDILDLVCYTKDLSFPDALKYVCDEIGISYYHDLSNEIPESLKILNLIDEMNFSLENQALEKVQKLDEIILSYYKPFVNKMFHEDGIDYITQREFEIGFDEETNRYTIPIRSEIGDLVGVKGRYFYRDVPNGENKYIYLEPCAKSKILYGLHKTMEYIKQSGKVYVAESEKAVMQLWSYGYRCVVSTGGKTLSQHQVELLVRLGVDIIFAFDKDVKKEEIEEISEKFPENLPIYYVYDEDNILEGHESPSDNSLKWQQLVKNNVYRIK